MPMKLSLNGEEDKICRQHKTTKPKSAPPLMERSAVAEAHVGYAQRRYLLLCARDHAEPLPANGTDYLSRQFCRGFPSCRANARSLQAGRSDRQDGRQMWPADACDIAERSPTPLA